MTRTSRVLGLTPKERGLLVATSALALVTLVASIGLLAQSSYLISRSALVTSTAALGLLVTGVRFFAVLRAAGRYAERYLGHRSAFQVVTRMRTAWFAQLTSRLPGLATAHRRGDLIARLGPDMETMQEYALRVLVPPAASLGGIAIAGAVLGVLNVRLGVTLVVALVLTGIVLPLAIRRAASGAQHTLDEARAAQWANLTETLACLDELHVNGRADLIRAVDMPLPQAERRVARVQAVGTGAAAVASGATLVLVLAFAIPLVTRGQLDGVALATIPLVALAAFEAIPPLVAAQEYVLRGRKAAARLAEIEHAPIPVPEPVTPTAIPSGALVVHDITVTHPDRTVPALRHFSLRLEPDATLGLCGVSGSGKSTLVGVLERFVPFENGTISIGDVDICASATDDVRAQFAVVQQHDHIFDTTIRDNLLLADPDATDAQLNSALDACMLSLPLDRACGPNGRELSGGERQRLLIARALLAERPFLILDEATAHLDRATARRVLHNVRMWRAGRATLVITHDPEALRGLDQVISLTDDALAYPADTTSVGSEAATPHPAPTIPLDTNTAAVGHPIPAR